MKRLLSFVFVTALFCAILNSCEHMSGPSYIGEYAGHIESTIMEDPTAFAGFYIDMALYDNNTCNLMTAVILEDNYTLDEVRHQNLRYGNVRETGFDVLDSSGAVVATATYCGPFNVPDAIIELRWNGAICPEWTQYAETFGWHQPCTMAFYNQNGSDIINK